MFISNCVKYIRVVHLLHILKYTCFDTVFDVQTVSTFGFGDTTSTWLLLTTKRGWLELTPTRKINNNSQYNRILLDKRFVMKLYEILK